MATKRRKIKTRRSCKHGKLKKPVRTKSGRKRRCKTKRRKKKKKSKRKHRMHKSKPLKRLTSGARKSDLSSSSKNKSKITAQAIITKNREIQKLQEQLAQAQRTCSMPQPQFSDLTNLVTVPQYIRFRMYIVNQPNIIPNDAKIFGAIGREVAKIYKKEHGFTTPHKLDDEGTMMVSKSKGLTASKFKASAYLNPQELWVIEDGFHEYLLKNNLHVNSLPNNIIKEIYKYKTIFLEKKADEEIEENLPLLSLMSKKALQRHKDRLLDDELKQIEAEINQSINLASVPRSNVQSSSSDKSLNELLEGISVNDSDFDMKEFDKLLDEF